MPLSLILTDLNLLDISGEDPIRTLQNDLAGVNPPRVVPSADATSERIERLGSFGVFAYLTKPYDISQLLEVIDAHCPTLETGLAGNQLRVAVTQVFEVPARSHVD